MTVAGGSFLPRVRTGLRRGLVGGLLLLLAAQALPAAWTHTPTVDEFLHLPIGLYHLRTGQHDLDRRSGPLVRTLSALPLLAMDVSLDTSPAWRGKGEGWWPWIFGTRFMRQNQERYREIFLAGRSVVIALALAGALGVYAWARRLHGDGVALMCLLLYATSPTIVGHASLATLDVGLTCFVAWAFYAAWRYGATRQLGWALVSGMLAGLALGAKHTAVILLPSIPLLLALGWPGWSRGELGRFVLGGTVMALAALLAVGAAFLFDGLPLPTALVEGVRFKVGDAGAPETPSFLLGEWSAEGWPWYYLAVMLFKMPLPLLLLLAVGTLTLALRRTCWRDGGWLALPPLLLLYALSFHYQAQFGIRYLLPALPFLLLIAGWGAAALLRRGRLGTAALGALLVWQTAGCLLTTPHQLAYFNELAGGPDHSRRILLDSNLDWGQDLGRLGGYLRRNGIEQIRLGYFGHVDPALYGIRYRLPPARFEPGLYAISANYLAGYPYAITYMGDRLRILPPGRWTWLDGFEPTARVGRSLFVFDLRNAKLEDPPVRARRRRDG